MNGVLSIITAAAAIISSLAALGAIGAALYVNYDAKQPILAVSIEHDRDHASNNLVITNIGKGVARDIVFINFDYSLVASDFQDHAGESFIANGIPTLVPGASRSTTILAGQNVNSFADKRSGVLVEYKTRSFFGKDKKRSEMFTLDYVSLYGSLYTVSDLHEIRKDLDYIAKAFKAGYR